VGEKKSEPVFDTFGVAHRHLGAAWVVQRPSCEDHQITAALYGNDHGMPKDLLNGFDMTFHIGALGDEVHHKDPVCAQDRGRRGLWRICECVSRRPQCDGNRSGCQDGWHKTQGGFRLDWTPPGDVVTLQGDFYKGSESKLASPDQAISGHNVIGRWNHAFTDGSALQVQAYYDYTKFSLRASGVMSLIPTISTFNTASPA
jgi:hypothetical protein